MGGMNLGMKLEDFLLNAAMMIFNAGSDPELKASLTKFGFDEEKIGQGKQLLIEADTLSKKQISDRSSRSEGCRILEKVREQAEEAFLKTLKTARFALQENMKILMLGEKHISSLSDWLTHAVNFYDNILKDEGFVIKMEEFGRSREKMQAERDVVAALLEKNSSQNNGIGEVLFNAKRMEKKICELAVWMSDFIGIARIAFESEPEQLEKLGIRNNEPKKTVH